MLGNVRPDIAVVLQLRLYTIPIIFFFSCTRPLYACFYDLVAVNKLIQTDSVTCFHLLAGVGS